MRHYLLAAAVSEDVASSDAIGAALYDVISGEAEYLP
ncbi:hypothetical protein BH10PSE1_BH10PSE1_00970 [soil metagenome]